MTSEHDLVRVATTWHPKAVKNAENHLPRPFSALRRAHGRTRPANERVHPTALALVQFHS